MNDISRPADKANSATKKRFIAGAVCPHCHTMDTIVVFCRNGVDVRQCVNCDFEETKSFITNTRELSTRVNQAGDSQQVVDTNEVQTIKVMGNSTTRKRTDSGK